jgi:hypothetical protein
MQIIGIQGMSGAELQREVQRGGRFVVFPYCVSVVLMTFRRSSDIYFLWADESHWSSALHSIILSLALGWWGLPWGRSSPLKRCW